ncbi:MAG: hypothetical protein J0M11_20770 [Anaerolineae bacterium]|nr:hypothetical protein [Anaerolineae bacterium]
MTLKLGEIKIPGRVNRLGLSLSPIIDKHCNQHNAAQVQREGFFKSEHRTTFGVIEVETEISSGRTNVDLQKRSQQHDS